LEAVLSLEYAILGFLTLSPMTGYDLKTQYFDGSVSHFWPADQAQIYRTLERMAADGWVEAEVQVQTVRPSRKVYHITTLGLAVLKKWLRESRPLPVERRPFLVQLYFARHLTKEELLALLGDQLRLHQERLAIYEAIVLPQTADPIMQQQLRFGAMTLDYGRRYEQMQIEWLAATIAQVEGYEE
jgi:DNA-binding PadR family transcriptional regulator